MFPASTGTTVSIKIVLDAKVQNNSFSNISKLGFCGNCGNKYFEILKYIKNVNPMGPKPSQRRKYVSSDNPGQNIVDKSTRLNTISLSMECFTAAFLEFCSTTVKISFLND